MKYLTQLSGKFSVMFLALLALSLGALADDTTGTDETTGAPDPETVALTDEIDRSPAVLDWPVDQPSGENAQVYEDFEKRLELSAHETEN
ncbi:MAG: hypothetical protein AB7P04_12605 [Bacteriovoracia bacterium]